MPQNTVLTLQNQKDRVPAIQAVATGQLNQPYLALPAGSVVSLVTAGVATDTAATAGAASALPATPAGYLYFLSPDGNSLVKVPYYNA